MIDNSNIDLSDDLGLFVSLSSRSGVLSSSGFLLRGQLIGLNLISLGDVDSFDQDGLVLVQVTLGAQVEFVISIFLLGFD